VTIVDPASVRPRLAEAAAASIEDMRRVLVETATGANKRVWVTINCKHSDRAGRYEIVVPDNRVRLDAVQALLHESLGRPGQAETAPSGALASHRRRSAQPPTERAPRPQWRCSREKNSALARARLRALDPPACRSLPAGRAGAGPPRLRTAASAEAGRRDGRGAACCGSGDLDDVCPCAARAVRQRSWGRRRRSGGMAHCAGHRAPARSRSRRDVHFASRRVDRP
jgi:hypothetical protein